MIVTEYDAVWPDEFAALARNIHHVGSTSIPGMMANGSERRVVLYVTVDPFDHRDGAGELRGHKPNLARLKEAATSWRPDTIVKDIWCAHLAEETLADPSLLALFLSGSYTDWMEAFREPEWQRMLDAYCALLRQTHVPILAVCGSHQLVAYAFGGWKAVGHMAARGAPAVSIAEEADGISRVPNPRVGEVGTFLYRRETGDPLFAGLAERPEDPLIFSQWHQDLVLLPGLPAESLLRPIGLECAALDPTFPRGPRVALQPPSLGETEIGPARTPSRRHVESVEECCRVQALRYDVPPAGRILYTTQFHPDLAGADSAGNRDHGIAMLHNFFSLADAVWAEKKARGQLT